MSKPASQNLTRQEKVAEREAVILSTARKMFNALGYAKTTISGIAQQSGVADGTVYLYFQNKDALARAVLSDFYGELTETARQGVDALDRADERLRWLATHHLSEVITHRRVLEMLPRLGLAIDSYEGSPLLALNKAYTAVFDRVAKDGIAAGQIRGDISLTALRDIFFGSLEYGARSILLKQKQKSVDEFVSDLICLILPVPAAQDSDIETRLRGLVERLEATTQQL